MRNARQQSRQQRSFYPSLLLILLVSHYIYYIAVFNGTYSAPLYLVILAILCAVVGYFGGYHVRFVLRKTANPGTAKPIRTYKYSQLRTAGLIFLLIGIVSHLYYYSSVPLTDYASSYTVSRGQGYITVFFNFWVLGMVMIEFLSTEGLNRPFLKWTNRLLIVLYTLFYFLILLKRRQLIILFLALFAVWGRKMKRSQKVLLYALGIIAVALFAIFGQVRGYMQNHTLMQTFQEIVKNYSADWFSLENYEGKYISRTLDDVYYYVKFHGHDPSVLLGVLFSMVPRRLLGGAKPLAFPYWYTKHFYPTLHAQGVGYAGCMVGELYLIGGVPLLVLGYLLIGYVCARLQKSSSRTSDVQRVMVYSLSIYTIMLLPRYDLACLLIDMVFLYTPLILFCRGNYTH